MTATTAHPLTYDNQSPRSPSGKWLVLLAAFLGWMFDGLEMGIFPQIARQALGKLLPGASLDTIKEWHQFITAMFLFGAALGGLVFGWLGDRLGRVTAMSASILVYSAFTGLLYFVQSPAQIAALRFVAAIGMGGEWALGVALVMEVWDARHRPILAGLIGAASNVGFVLVGVIGAAFKIDQNNWRFVAIVGAAPALLTFIIQIFVPESHKWKQASRSSPSRPLRELFATAQSTKTALLAISFSTVALLATWGAVQNIPAWVDDLTKDPSAKGFAQIWSGIGAIVGCLAAPAIAAVLNRRVAYLLLCVCSLSACEYLFLGFDHYSAGFLAVNFLVGATSAAFYGWLPLYLPELFPTRVRATGQGIAYNFGRIVSGIGVLWGGTIGGSYAKMGAIVSLVYVIGMVIIWLAPETKGKPLPD